MISYLLFNCELLVSSITVLYTVMENSPASPSPSPGMLESQTNSHTPSRSKKKNDAFHFLLRNHNPVWKEWDKYVVDYGKATVSNA